MEVLARTNTGFVETLQGFLDIYSRNVEQVSEEVLNTHYKKPFMKLKRDIRKAAYDVMISRMVDPFLFPRDLSEELKNQFIDMVTAYRKQFDHYLWVERDATAFCKACESTWGDLVLFVVHNGGLFHGYVYLDNLNPEMYEAEMKRRNGIAMAA